MRFWKGVIVGLLLAGFAFGQVLTFDWLAPATYTNAVPIPAADALSYTLLCGDTQGGPYDNVSFLLDPLPPSMQDMAVLVANTPGDYYCVLTATSSLWNTTSDPSPEVSFSVAPTDLGLQPMAPVLFLVT